MQIRHYGSGLSVISHPVSVDWEEVERTMRESVPGVLNRASSQLWMYALTEDIDRYSVLVEKVMDENNGV